MRHDEGQGWGGSDNVHYWRRNFGQRGWLRPTVLRILEGGPKNGMEIMDSIHEMSYGWWRPSPGSIYPLLEQLESEGMIKKDKEGKYELTDAYRKVAGPLNSTEEVLTNMEGNVSYLEELAQNNDKEFGTYKTRIEGIAQRLAKLK
jgi:DNA-binding PadR family transcriptional regulator